MRLFEIVPAAQAAGLLDATAGCSLPAARPERSTITSIKSPACTWILPSGCMNCSMGTKPSDLYPKSTMTSVSMDVYDAALQQLAFVGRCEMTVVFDELLVVRLFSGHGGFRFCSSALLAIAKLPSSCYYNGMEEVQIIDTSVLQNYSGAARGSQPQQFPVYSSFSSTNIRGSAHAARTGGKSGALRFPVGGMGGESG